MEEKTLPTDETEKAFVRELVESVYENFRKQALSGLNYDEEAADDCMLCMYETAMKKAHVLFKHPKPEAWLAKTLRHCIRRKIKRLMSSPERKITFVNIDLLEDLLPDPQEIEYEDAPDDMQIEKAKEYVLSQLTETERTTYELRYTEGKTMAEIAQTLSISEDAVKARLHRIKLKIGKIAKNIFSDGA